MLDALITSKTRIKLLFKFFLNANRTDYLRNLESDLGDNSNAIRTELNKLEEAGLLKSYVKGNKKFFLSNTSHPLFSDINSILMKISGLDELVNRVLNNVGDLELVYLTGDLAKGTNSDLLDLIVIGEINKEYFIDLVMKAEGFIGKKIRYVIYTPEEFHQMADKIIMPDDLLLWKK